MESLSATEASIEEYYDYSTILYNLFAQNSLHYGQWEEGITQHNEANSYVNKLTAHLINLTREDHVLDAGCGVGGTSLYIAENFGCRVEGITLSGLQVQIAIENAKKKPVTPLLRFSQQNFKSTNFSDATFTKVIAIESMSHETNRSKFFKEMYRVMKSGGHILVMDGFLVKNAKHRTQKEDRQYRNMILGWHISDLDPIEQIEKFMSDVGFESINFIDRTAQVLKSAKTIHNTSIYFYPLVWLLHKLRWVPKTIFSTTQANIAQKQLLDRGVFKYGIFIARKPF